MLSATATAAAASGQASAIATTSSSAFRPLDADTPSSPLFTQGHVQGPSFVQHRGHFAGGIAAVTAVNNRVPLLSSPELQLRFLTPSDLPEVKRLCKEWFPIDYPDVWYDDITSNEKFYSYACVYQGKIIGLVVAEIRDYMKLPKEDSELLASTFR